MPTNEHPTPIQRGEDARKNWITINQLSALLQPLASEVRRLGSAIADLRLKPQLKEGGGGGIRYRGDFALNVQYEVNDLIILPYGAKAASYLCVSRPPTSGILPYTGNYFVVLGRVVDQSNWL